jgi:ABC-type bacteriocin/lantibiotic exporter with double-glycine peptidase domain
MPTARSSAWLQDTFLLDGRPAISAFARPGSTTEQILDAPPYARVDESACETASGRHHRGRAWRQIVSGQRSVFRSPARFRPTRILILDEATSSLDPN